MHEEEPTLGLGLKIWWAWMWRVLLLAMTIGFLIGFVVGIIGVAIGLEQSTVTVIAGLGGLCAGVYVSAWTFKRFMVKGFGRYRMIIVSK